MTPASCLLLLSLMVMAIALPAAQEASGREGIPVRQPGPNAGRTGTYPAETGIEGYRYHIYVPKSYSGTQGHAGLSVFFHGQNGQKGAATFPGELVTMLEQQQLIGINMQYLDGDNTKDTARKVEAAIIAMGQAMADYRIVAGRGNISCFSGGGHPCSMIMARLAKRTAGAEIGRDWPFCQASIYGTNILDYKGDWGEVLLMNWQFCLGEKEWNLYAFGPRLTAVSSSILARPDTSRDINVKMTVGKNHCVLPADLQASAAMFERSDIMLAPFVYEPDFTIDPELVVCLALARGRKLGEAAIASKRLAESKAASAAVRKQARFLSGRINERIGEMLALVTRLAGTDPPLATHYVALALRQVDGLDEPSTKLRKIQETLRASKPAAKALEAANDWLKRYPEMIGDNGLLKPQAKTYVEGVVAASIPGSIIHRWASEYLAMVH